MILLLLLLRLLPVLLTLTPYSLQLPLLLLPRAVFSVFSSFAGHEVMISIHNTRLEFGNGERQNEPRACAF